MEQLEEKEPVEREKVKATKWLADGISSRAGLQSTAGVGVGRAFARGAISAGPGEPGERGKSEWKQMEVGG